MRVRIRRLILLLLGGVAAVPLAAQTRAARPAIVVLNLRFDGEHATVLEPGTRPWRAPPRAGCAPPCGRPADSRSLTRAPWLTRWPRWRRTATPATALARGRSRAGSTPTGWLPAP